MARPKKTKKIEESNKLLVTKERYAEMTAELNTRLTVTRDEVANEISVARDLGDLSENQAYSDAMNHKDLNEARIEELEYLISIAQIIQKDNKGHVVGIGDSVEIKKASDNTVRTFIIVGKQETQEADSRAGKISIDSPIGAAVLGKMPGDKFSVTSPNGTTEYQIVKIV